MNDRDAARLWDMLTYAREVVQSLEGIGFEAFQADRNLSLATERRLEIIGEAASHVSSFLRERYPAIPWRKIIAQRNVLAHEYGEVRQEAIFRVATVHVPELVEQLEPLVPPPPDDY